MWWMNERAIFIISKFQYSVFHLDGKFISNKSVWLRPTTVAVAMKLFTLTQAHFNKLGFYAPQPPNESCQLNYINGFYMLSQWAMLASVAGFLILKAKSSFEVSNNVYMMITSIGMIVQFTSLFYRMGSVKQLIRNYEEFIENRKCWFELFVCLVSNRFGQMWCRIPVDSLIFSHTIANFGSIFTFSLIKWEKKLYEGV